jgi:hypothetical protein
VIDPTAKIGEHVSIGPLCWIGPETRLAIIQGSFLVSIGVGGIHENSSPRRGRLTPQTAETRITHPNAGRRSRRGHPSRVALNQSMQSAN